MLEFRVVPLPTKQGTNQGEPNTAGVLCLDMKLGMLESPGISSRQNSKPVLRRLNEEKFSSSFVPHKHCHLERGTWVHQPQQTSLPSNPSWGHNLCLLHTELFDVGKHSVCRVRMKNETAIQINSCLHIWKQVRTRVIGCLSWLQTPSGCGIN